MGEKLVTILCIGDSIVNGYPYLRADSWPFLLQKMLLESGREMKIINAGINGESSDALRKRFSAVVMQHQPDLAIVASGANDFIFTEATPEQVFDNLQAVYQMAAQLEVIPAAVAPLLTVPEIASRCWADGTDYTRVNHCLKELRLLIAQESQSKGLAWIDLQSGYEKLLKQSGPEACYEDGLHPAKAGYQAIAGMVRDWLDQKEA